MGISAYKGRNAIEGKLAARIFSIAVIATFVPLGVSGFISAAPPPLKPWAQQVAECSRADHYAFQIQYGDPLQMWSVELSGDQCRAFLDEAVLKTWDADTLASAQAADPASDQARWARVRAFANKVSGEQVRWESEGIFAPAPASISGLAAGAGVLVLEFGIRDGAWAYGNTNGVCFSVLADGHSLFQRCLDPVGKPEDRGRQAAVVELSPDVDTVKLQTACADDCNRDWSYWSRAEFLNTHLPSDH